MSDWTGADRQWEREHFARLVVRTLGLNDRSRFGSDELAAEVRLLGARGAAAHEAADEQALLVAECQLRTFRELLLRDPKADERVWGPLRNWCQNRGNEALALMDEAEALGLAPDEDSLAGDRREVRQALAAVEPLTTTDLEAFPHLGVVWALCTKWEQVLAAGENGPAL
jgi:hypothetical protein